MTRQRLRPAHSQEELNRIYARPHNHTVFQDHLLRVAVTIQVGRWLVGPKGAGSAADLSCGDGAILKGLPAQRKVYGDYAPGYDYTGPLEETIRQLGPVGLYVCSETLEHLDDPDLALKLIRPKTRDLLLSTPIDAWDDENEEHYWAWSREDVEEMLQAAGFTPQTFVAVDFRSAGLVYCFGVWGCR